jgi:hypothetical protein
MSADLPPQVKEPVTDALLRFRAHAAEVALLTLVGQLQSLLKQAEEFATRLQEINRQFPLGDDTPEGARDLQFDAIRAQVPQLAHLSNDQLAAMIKQNATANPTPD